MIYETDHPMLVATKASLLLQMSKSNFVRIIFPSEQAEQRMLGL
jgi:hypothetical protein